MKNNQDVIAKKINELKLAGVSAMGDDGSVCVEIAGDQDRVVTVANIILDKIGDVKTSDGVQSGSIWINNDKNDIHGELLDVIWSN